MKSVVLALGVALLASGCASRNVTIPPAGTAKAPSNATTAESTISITIPAPAQTTSATRRAAYISTASNSMVLAPQGQNPIVMPLSTTTPGCRTLNGARICTFRVSLPTGTYTMRIALYASTDGTGVPLALVSSVTTITQNATNNLDFTLNAVVSTMSLALVPDGNLALGTSATRTIAIGVADAGGATIVVGTDNLVDVNGSPVTIRLVDTDTSGATSITPTVVAGSASSTLLYNGSAPNGTIILAQATNSANNSIVNARTAFSVGGTSGCTGAAAGLRMKEATASCDFHFLSFPLDCGDPQCTFQYSLGAYTPQIITTVLDHSLSGAPAQPSAVYVDANNVVVAFNGEYVDETPKYQPPCLTSKNGPIHLNTVSSSPGRAESPYDLVRLGVGCNGDEDYTAYEGHPGYDYRALLNTPVYPAAIGKVVPGRCIQTAKSTSSCADWGLVGIDHHNGYVSQYMHLSTVYVSAGTEIDDAFIAQHRPIGLSGHTGLPAGFGAHLHFEVLAHIPMFGPEAGDYNPTHWAFVDPYGWTGGHGLPYSPDGDPIYSAKLGIQPMQLWK